MSSSNTQGNVYISSLTNLGMIDTLSNTDKIKEAQIGSDRDLLVQSFYNFLNENYEFGEQDEATLDSMLTWATDVLATSPFGTEPDELSLALLDAAINFLTSYSPNAV
jgi:hypothetical protein